MGLSVEAAISIGFTDRCFGGILKIRWKTFLKESF